MNFAGASRRSSQQRTKATAHEDLHILTKEYYGVKVQVFGSGSGCAPCKTTLRNAEIAVAELGLPTQVEYITRIQQMLELGISGSPALVVDGDVKCVGRALDVAAIKAVLTSSKTEQP